MKKFLSLVLSLAMALSLVTVSAGAADFEDDGDITYQEAVNVIAGIGVVDGYSDGTFDPDGVLTRGAAAKIICNLILGPTTADALSASSAPYRDVPTTNTFAGYITYCSQQGIISGYADGTFRPTDTLSGNAFMKILLGALGYDSDIENYTGSNWTVNVIKEAVGIGLDDGNDDFVGSQAVTREEACLYAYNMLQATMVEYDSSNTIIVGDVQVTTSSSRHDVENTNTRTDGNIDDDDLMQFAERYFTDLRMEDGSDDFGRPSVTWNDGSTEIGTYVNHDDLVETWTAKVTKGDLYSTVGSSVVSDLEDGDATLTYWVDGVRTVVDENDVDDFMVRNNTQAINAGNDTDNGSLTEVYVDDDNNVTLVVIYTYVFQASADYSSSNDSVRIASAGDTSITLDSYTLDGEDFDIADVAEDDYLLINATRTGSSNRYEVQVVTPAELVSGEVKSYSLEDDVTVDGTTYEYSAKTNDDGVRSEIQATGGSVTLVLDEYGYVIAVDDTILSGNYVFIAETANASNMSTSSVVANAYFADGTNDEITLKRVAGSTARDDLRAAIGWYTYSVDSNDRYTLNEVSGSYDAWTNYNNGWVTTAADEDGDYLLSNGVTRLPLQADDDTVRANENTVFVIVDEDDDTAVYTGISNAPDVYLTDDLGENDVYRIGYVYRNGYANYVFISVDDINATVDDSAADDSYMFIVRLSATRNSGDSTYYVYEAIVDGAVTTVNSEDQLETMTLHRKVRINSDGYITGTEPVTAEHNEFYADTNLDEADVGYSNGVLTIGDEYDFLINSDSQLFLILDYSRDPDKAQEDEEVYDLIDDSGARHTVDNLSASALRSTLDEYTVSGELYVVLDDDYDGGDGSTTVTSLFLYVNDATYTGEYTPGDDNTDEENLAQAQENLDDFLADVWNADDLAVTVDVNDKSSSAVADAVEAALAEQYSDEEGISFSATVLSWSSSNVNSGDTGSASVRVTVTATVSGQTARQNITLDVPVSVTGTVENTISAEQVAE